MPFRVRALHSNIEWSYDSNALKLAPTFSIATVKVVESAYFPALATMLFSLCEHDVCMRTAVLAHVQEFALGVNHLSLYEFCEPVFDSVGCLTKVTSAFLSAAALLSN